MSLSLDRLKSAYRAYLQGLVPKTRTSCPPPSELMRFFSNTSSRRFKSRILDHVAGCGLCAAEFEIGLGMDRAARAFTAAAAKLAEEAQETASPRKSTRGFWGLGRIAALGASLTALAAGIMILAGRPTSLPVDEPLVLRATSAPLSIRLEAPLGSVDLNAAVAFLWRAGDGSLGGPCHVSLFDDTLVRIWEGWTTNSGSLFLPQAVQISLVAGRRYYWGISVFSGDEAVDSDLAEFWLEPDLREANSSTIPVRK